MLVKELLKNHARGSKEKNSVLDLLETDVNRNFVLVGKTVSMTGETFNDVKTCY